MLKPTKTYKMSKPLKVSLALSTFKNAEQRSAWKRAMIQAELAAAIVPKSIKSERKTGLLTGYVAVDGGTSE